MNASGRWMSILAMALGFTRLACADEFVTPPAGGTGGDHGYNLSCGTDGVMVGLMGKWGLWIDSIGVICRKVNQDGTLGASFEVGPRGGPGGSTARTSSCDPANVVQRLETVTSSYAVRIRAICGSWSPGTRVVARPPDPNPPDDAEVGAYYTGDRGRLECPTDGQPAKGIRGKHGVYIDSIALVCGAVTLGSIDKGPSPSGGATGPLPSRPPPVIKFDEAPAPGALISVSGTRGADILIRASGGATALSMTMSVTESTYRPFLELVTPPAPATFPPPNPPTAKPNPTGGPQATAGSTAAASSVAAITRVVRLRANTPLITSGYSPVVTIPVIVTVRNANGDVATRAFALRLLP
jgi:hypothetical protein